MTRTAGTLVAALGLALVAGAGCRSFDGGRLRRGAAPPVADAEMPSDQEIVDRVAQAHADRARRVESLKVTDLVVDVETYQRADGRSRSPMLFTGRIGGFMVLERPRNLRISLKHPAMLGTLADLGSNAQEFWFSNDRSQEMVEGTYAETAGYADPLLASIRPDWVFEVLGLMPIDPQARIEADDDPETILLTERRGALRKETVISVLQQRVVEHRLYDGEGNLIAQARLGKPRLVAVETPTPTQVPLPEEVRFTIPQVADLTLELNRVAANPANPAAADAFVKPEKPGFHVYNILDYAGASPIAMAENRPRVAPAARSAPSPAEVADAGDLAPVDASLARTDTDTEANADADEPVGTVDLNLPPLPAPAERPTATRRSSWEKVPNNRFRPDVLGGSGYSSPSRPSSGRSRCTDPPDRSDPGSPGRLASGRPRGGWGPRSGPQPSRLHTGGRCADPSHPGGDPIPDRQDDVPRGVPVAPHGPTRPIRSRIAGTTGTTCLGASRGGWGPQRPPAVEAPRWGPLRGPQPPRRRSDRSDDPGSHHRPRPPGRAAGDLLRSWTPTAGANGGRSWRSRIVGDGGRHRCGGSTGGSGSRAGRRGSGRSGSGRSAGRSRRAASRQQEDDEAPLPVRFGLNTSTIHGQEVPVPEQVRIAAEAGYDAIEPWIRDLDRYVEGGGSLDDLRKQIEDAGLQVPSAIGFFEWAVDDDAKRAAGLDEARRSMERVAAIGGIRLAAPPVGMTDTDGADLRAIADRYRALLELGEEIGVTPELEVWGFSKTLGRLGETAYVAVESGRADACILPDVYHLYKGGSGFEGLRYLSGKTIQVFHLNDYPADPPRSEINDAARVFPGDGVAPLGELVRILFGIGFEGTFSLELFNRDYWSRDPLAVAREGLAKMKRVVRDGLAVG